jgi:hypothetical protein
MRLAQRIAAKVEMLAMQLVVELVLLAVLE